MEKPTSLFPTAKGAVEAAKEWLGTRVGQRSTNNNEASGELATYLYALTQDAKTIDDLNAGAGPPCALPGFLKLADYIADVRAGIDGWETQQGIRAFEAAAEGTTIQAERRRGDD